MYVIFWEDIGGWKKSMDVTSYDNCKTANVLYLFIAVCNNVRQDKSTTQI